MLHLRISFKKTFFKNIIVVAKSEILRILTEKTLSLYIPTKKFINQLNIQVQSVIIVCEESETVYDSKERKPFALKLIMKYESAIISQLIIKHCVARHWDTSKIYISKKSPKSNFPQIFSKGYRLIRYPFFYDHMEKINKC